MIAARFAGLGPHQVQIADVMPQQAGTQALAHGRERGGHIESGLQSGEGIEEGIDHAQALRV
jgi:hypothetical protein